MFLNVDTTVIELRVLKIYRDAKRYPCNCFTTYKVKMNKLDDLNQKAWLESNVDDGFKDEDLDSDGLPEPIGVDTFLNNLPKLLHELIEGVVRIGHKMMISGASKSGKSFLLMQLAIALSEGTTSVGLIQKDVQSLTA